MCVSEDVPDGLQLDHVAHRSARRVALHVVHLFNGRGAG
jgi:hypothetical protein